MTKEYFILDLTINEGARNVFHFRKCFKNNSLRKAYSKAIRFYLFKKKILNKRFLLGKYDPKRINNFYLSLIFIGGAANRSIYVEHEFTKNYPLYPTDNLYDSDDLEHDRAFVLRYIHWMDFAMLDYPQDPEMVLQKYNEWVLPYIEKEPHLYNLW